MADEPDDAALAEIVELIEGAAFSRQHWDEAVEAIWRLLPGTRLAFQTRDDKAPGTVPIYIKGWDEHDLVSYEAHYAALNPWVGLWSNFPLLVPVWTENSLPSSSFANSEFYCDWLLKVGEAQCATGIKLMHAEGRSASLDIHYGPRGSEKSHDRARRLLTSVAPVLHRSIAAASLPRSHSGAGVLDLLLDAAFIVSRNGAVADLNAEARRLLDDRIMALLAPNGRLSVLCPIADTALHREIRSIYSGLQTVAEPASIRVVTGDSVLSMSIFGVVHPASTQAGAASLFSPSRAALVVVKRQTRSAAGGLQRLASEFGLSPAEMRIAAALKDGTTLRAASEHLGIAYETARSQLRSIFGKVGVQRQVDLVRLLISFDN